MSEATERAVRAYVRVHANTAHWRDPYKELAAPCALAVADEMACAFIGIQRGSLHELVLPMMAPPYHLDQREVWIDAATAIVLAHVLPRVTVEE